MKEDERKLAHGILHCKTITPAMGVAREIRMHNKRLEYILNKWMDKGWWECGVSARTGWMTEIGKKVLSELTKTVS